MRYSRLHSYDCCGDVNPPHRDAFYWLFIMARMAAERASDSLNHRVS